MIKSSKTISLILLLISINCSTLANEESSHYIRGKQEFIDSCSLCHGENGKGDGVFSEILIIPSADLTQLRKKNNGYFPYKDIYVIIDGREIVKQHGPRYMPIWGDRFNTALWADVNEEYADTLVKGKIFELLLYLETIQEWSDDINEHFA